jgi:hypothetical protein
LECDRLLLAGLRGNSAALAHLRADRHTERPLLGVSVSAIGWLAEIFPLLYVVLAIPAGRLLDSRFRPSLAAGGGLMAGGGLLRLGGQTFAWAMAGQLAVAVAQPVILSAVGKRRATTSPKTSAPPASPWARLEVSRACSLP